LTRNHNIARNDPFVAIEVFENLIEFYSVALPKQKISYEIPLEEKLVCFADPYDAKNFTTIRAFCLIIEAKNEFILRKLIMNHDKILGEEDLNPRDLQKFEKPKTIIDHAIYVKRKIVLKSKTQIIIANEGVLIYP
jgi:hypothetical protein